jgi:gluconolactonase
VRFETLAEGYGLVEAPRPDGSGGVLFSDVVGGGVHRWTPGGVELVLPRRRGIGGLVPHASGGVVVSGRDLSHGERTVLAAPAGVAGFNDLVTDDEGGILAGALRFNPLAGEDPAPGEVWRLAPDGSAAVFAEGVVWPNGIGIAPDGGTVYVTDFATGEVLAFDAGGGGRRVLARVPDGSPDGLAIDAEGRIWVALGPAGAIARFAPDGTLEERIDTPADFVASVAFDGTSLLVATMGALLRGDAGVAGRPVPPARVEASG